MKRILVFTIAIAIAVSSHVVAYAGTAQRTQATTTSMPGRGTQIAAGSLSVRQLGTNALPPCRMDSFVAESRSQAWFIYGDEGGHDDSMLPPFFDGFKPHHRINAGIFDERDKGLTTAHGSYLPDAWGYDEFIAPPGEWSQSGRNNGNNGSQGTDQPSSGNGGGGSAGGTGGGSSGAGPDLPPSPGPGYVPEYAHGVFIGYLSPDEVARAQSDWAGALWDFINSDRYVGGEAEWRSIAYELGKIDSPF